MFYKSIRTSDWVMCSQENELKTEAGSMKGQGVTLPSAVCWAALQSISQGASPREAEDLGRKCETSLKQRWGV